MSERTKKHEGFRSKIYKDTKGKRTVGYGFNVDDKTIAKILPRAVVLGQRELTQPEADLYYSKYFYPQAQRDAMTYASPQVWKNLDPVRQEVLTDMAYNMGLNSLSGFENMKANLIKGDMVNAAKEILRSEYAKQLKNRAKENYKLFLTGKVKSKK